MVNKTYLKTIYLHTYLFDSGSGSGSGSSCNDSGDSSDISYSNDSSENSSFCAKKKSSPKKLVSK